MKELRRFRFELGDGEHVVGDELPGDDPTIVFLHGLGSIRSGEKSNSLLEHARRGNRRFLRFDLRGHGESSGRLGAITLSESIADVVQVLEQRARRAWLVGSSLGGLIATHAAVRRPDLVERLCLLAPAFGLLPNLAGRLDARGRMWTNEGHGFFVEPKVLDDARKLDEEALPLAVRMPVLVVHGTDDEVVPSVVSKRFVARVPHPQKALWLIPGGDHRLNAFANQIWPRLDALAS